MLVRVVLFSFCLLLLFLLDEASARKELTRDDMMEFLRWKQMARTGFDSRWQQQIEPIGYVAGKPIWPRITERIKSKYRVFFDDDNFAYNTNERSVLDVLERMDREENYKKILNFLNRYTK